MGGEGRGKGKGRGWGKGGEMTQTLYAHTNKKLKKAICIDIIFKYIHIIYLHDYIITYIM
jgi:hypothetical protein